MDVEENRRLAPLVEIAYHVYQGIISFPQAPPAPPKPPIEGCSEAEYRKGLEREIEERFSSPPGALDYLLAKVREGSLKGFSEADCSSALSILDALLQEALFVESSYGDSSEAISELKARFPGWNGRIYSDLIGYYGWVNR